YLKEGLEVTIAMHGDRAVAIEMPGKVEYEITETQPAVKGDTVSGNVLKDAIMENGLMVRVPIFVNQGDKIRVNTSTCEYVERVN
ncbi:elongation factor P, partial [Patescibacteria group bacterium]|nr:elongation factor P [Patescibacteria group bacterium]